MEIVRDRREKGWFYLDNEYLNGYAKIFGPIGTAIYVSLCRHADVNQRCWPSMAKIAEENNIVRNTVTKYLAMFVAARIISIKREKDPKTKKWKNTVYTLLDKSQWKSHAQRVSMEKPCPNDEQSHAQRVSNKETHKKKTNISQTTKVAARKNMRHIKENAFEDEYEKKIDIEGNPIKSPALKNQRRSAAARRTNAKLLLDARQLLDHYRGLYLARISDKEPLIDEQRYRGQVSVFLKKFGLEEMKRLCTLYINTKDRFYRDNAWSLNIFLSYDTINKLNIKN